MYVRVSYIRQIVYTAFILVLIIIFQSLRFFLPIPLFIAPFVIGGLVNACLLISSYKINLKASILLALIAPCMAFLQYQIPLPIFIFPIFLGNSFLIIIFKLLQKNQFLALFCASIIKALIIFIFTKLILSFVVLPTNLVFILTFTMSWPQFFSGIIGGIICLFISDRVK